MSVRVGTFHIEASGPATEVAGRPRAFLAGPPEPRPYRIRRP